MPLNVNPLYVTTLSMCPLYVPSLCDPLCDAGFRQQSATAGHAVQVCPSMWPLYVTPLCGPSMWPLYVTPLCDPLCEPSM